MSTSALAYIDDCVLLSESLQGMLKQVHRLNWFYAWAGLEINSAKCTIFVHTFADCADMCTSQVQINGEALLQYSLHLTYKYLGMEIAGGGSWAAEKARVRRTLAEAVAALRHSPYTPSQLEQVVLACLIPIFRYWAGLVDWTERELSQITATWANARRLAWKLAPGSPHCLHTLPRAQGGGQLPHTCVLWAKEMMGLVTAC